MDLVVLVVVAALLWQAEKRWHMLGQLSRWLNRRIGISLPLAALLYAWAVLPTLLTSFRSRGPQYSHAGAAELGAIVFTAIAVLIVLPASVYDISKKKWHGALSIPLSVGIYFAWAALFHLLITSGRMVLTE